MIMRKRKSKKNESVTSSSANEPSRVLPNFFYETPKCFENQLQAAVKAAAQMTSSTNKSLFNEQVMSSLQSSSNQ